MSSGVRDKYNVAINGKGYMLRGAPGFSAYQRSIIPSQVDRLAISDIAYSDFSGQGLFYLAQTDWSSGIKSEKIWRDDGKFYYSSNIDAYSEFGSIKLPYSLVAETGVSGSSLAITAGIYGQAERASGYIKTQYFVAQAGDGNTTTSKLYYKEGETDAWTSLATLVSTARSMITQIILHKNKIFYLSAPVGSDTTETVKDYYKGSVTDHTTAVNTASGFASAVSCARSACEVGNTLYVAVDKTTSDLCAIVKTADSGTNWSLLVDLSGKNFVADMIGYGDGIYYLLDTNGGQGGLELRYYDLLLSTDTLVKRFPAGAAWREFTTGTSTEEIKAHGTGGRYLFVFEGKLVVVVPKTVSGSMSSDGELWEYDGNTLSIIFSTDDQKKLIGAEALPFFNKGGVEHINRIHFANLVYDGSAFFSGVENYADAIGSRSLPLISNGKLLYYTGTLNDTEIIQREVYQTYRSTANRNYLIFNEMSPISAIDKLLSAVTIIFNTFDVGESIKVQYSIDNMDTWTTLGTASDDSEGTKTKRVFEIPGDVIFTKIWFKIFLNGDGTSTPSLRDFIMTYKPMPDFKNRWSIGLNFSDSVKLLNRQEDQRDGNELNSELWNEKFTKQSVVFEDVDYVECSLVSAITSAGTSALIDSGSRLPRQGRIRAVSGSVAEEMYFTSSTSNKILGLNRAQRGTIARAYSSSQKLDNGYNVYIEDIKTNISFTDENKTESIAQVLLIEA